MTVVIPEFSEHPVAQLNRDPMVGYTIVETLGSNGVLGDMLVADHIGYSVDNLAAFTRLVVRMGEDVEGAVWAASLLFLGHCSRDSDGRLVVMN